MRILTYLGPEGTFSHEAAMVLVAHAKYELKPMKTITDVIRSVDGDANCVGIIPLENSLEGSVSVTLDSLVLHKDIRIIKEIVLPVTFTLSTKSGTKHSDIKTVSTHPHAQNQVRDWLTENLPGVRVLPALSTAEAAQNLQEQFAHYQATICSRAAAAHYDLEVLDEITTSQRAFTRFVVLAQRSRAHKPTGVDKTTLFLYMHKDHPGALLEILTEFSVCGINLTRIESRPTKKNLGDYYFSIDCEGHIQDRRIAQALKGLHRVCANVIFLGSYPREDGEITKLKKGMSNEDFEEADMWFNETIL